MSRKKHIQPGEKVELKLTEAQRSLLLDRLPLLPDEVETAIRSSQPPSPLRLTLDDLDDLAGHVAAEANHTSDKRLRKGLDAIFSKIQDVLDSHTDEPPPMSRKIEDARREQLVSHQSVQLAEWAAKMLVGAEQLGIKARSVARFPLPEAERAVLLMTPTLDEKARKKLARPNPKLTVGEVGGLLMAVAEALLDASPLQGVALIMTAKSLMDCLESEVAGALHPVEAKGSTCTIYRLKITLAEIEPPIWRLVEVPDCTLGELHAVIQVAMGWQDSHLHQFLLNGNSYGRPSPDDLGVDVRDEDGIRLSQIFHGRKKPRLIYEYDFGDGWRHEIRLEKVLEPEPKARYPRCVEGERACPPEDCGGPWGYADFLEAMADPEHENYEDMKEWIGGRFDPEKFSLDKVNKQLKQTF
jgi:hypothetical protein